MSLALSPHRHWVLKKPETIVLIIITSIALLSAVFSPNGASIDANNPLGPNSLIHLLGTDELGRDVLARLAMGTRVSLLVGLVAAASAVGIGSLYGIFCAISKPWVDALLMRFVDVLYSLPFLMVVVLLAQLLQQHTFIQALLPTLEPQWLQLLSLIAALAFFGWPESARLIRGVALKINTELFIESATALGSNKWRLMSKHFWPNLLPIILASLSITLPRAILTEATLSFIGLGISPPWCSLGTMISDGWQMIRLAPQLMLYSAVLLIIIVWALNQLGQQLLQQR